MFSKKQIIYLLGISLFAVALTACSGTLRSTWVNFNSYYNTFYNANNSFNRGYKQFENQVDRINPERPIRIHRAPVRVGRADFEDAIDRGSDLLMRFPESKYVDDAVALIGKSYYFLENFFNAEQKFVELYSITQDDARRQEAVIWRARVMLDLNRYNEAINYLDVQMNASDMDWDRRLYAEAQLILAQHLVKTNRWEEAGVQLFEALPELRDRQLRARGYFLHGQILEYLGEFAAAEEAYDRVRRFNPVYQLVYLSQLKKGQMIRQQGEFATALRHFNSMARNNNNFEFIAEINYEIARTQWFKGDVLAAQDRYYEVLYRSLRTPTRETLAKTHYGLAEMYRYDFLDYNLAAAYYDSSARSAQDLELLPHGFDARDLSQSFLEFSRLHNDAVKMDSLIRLGSLPPAKFDSVITALQNQRRVEMERELRQRQRDAGRIVNVDEAEFEELADDGESGFLLNRNRQLMAQAAMQFQAIWGDRPLVDDWRRQEAVRLAVIVAEDNEEASEELIFANDPQTMEFELDLSEIPRTPEEIQEMSKNLARVRYEIGNVFFLSLELPDSASVYFRDIAENHRDTDFAPQAMYSLSELYYSREDQTEARHWAGLVADLYPETIYAQRLNNRFNLGIPEKVVEETPEDIFKNKWHSLLDTIHTKPPLEAANIFLMYAAEDTLTQFAADAYFSAAQQYITVARDDSTFAERLDTFNIKKTEITLKRQEFTALRDSANVVLQDSTITEDLRSFWETISDSIYVEPDTREYFPYVGELWDKARASLDSVVVKHGNYTRISRVNSILNEIRLPVEPEDPEDEMTELDDVDENLPEDVSELDETEIVDDSIIDTEFNDEIWNMPEDQSVTYGCDDIGARLNVVGGMNLFIEQTGLLDVMKEQGILDAFFIFLVNVDTSGNINQITPLDEEDDFGFQVLLVDAMERDMSFIPVIHEGNRVPVRCELMIPLSTVQD